MFMTDCSFYSSLYICLSVCVLPCWRINVFVKEPEVVASVYMKNLSMYLNRKVIK